jgi:hypothetical protein
MQVGDKMVHMHTSQNFHKIHDNSNLKRSHHLFSYNIICNLLWGLHQNGKTSWDSKMGSSKILKIFKL